MHRSDRSDRPPPAAQHMSEWEGIARIRSSTSINVLHTAQGSPPITPGTNGRSGTAGAKHSSGQQYPDWGGSTRTPRTAPPATVSAAPINHLALGVLFLSALLLMLVLFSNFPEVSESDKELIKFPRSLTDVRSLSAVLRKYRDQNLGVVVAGFCAIYIFLQSFAIPGALFLSILAGPLFGVWRGLMIVSVVATTGSSICYLVSYYLGRGLVERCFPAMLARLRNMIARRAGGGNLFFYLLFLRISPLLPNWFISLAAPILDIPLTTFAAATFIGLMPANYLHVTTGLKLEELDTSDEGGGNPINFKALGFLFAIAFLALLPTIFKSKFEQWSGAGAPATVGSNGAEVTLSPPAEVAEQTEQQDAAHGARSNKKKVGKSQ